MSSSTVKNISIVISILGFIGSLIAGSQFSAKKLVGIGASFNFSIFLSCLLIIAFFILLLVIGASVLNHCEEIEYNQKTLICSLKNIENSLNTNTTSNSQQTEKAYSFEYSTRKNTSMAEVKKDGYWICAKCGTKNADSSKVCKGCDSSR